MRLHNLDGTWWIGDMLVGARRLDHGSWDVNAYSDAAVRWVQEHGLNVRFRSRRETVRAALAADAIEAAPRFRRVMPVRVSVGRVRSPCGRIVFDRVAGGWEAEDDGCCTLRSLWDVSVYLGIRARQAGV